MKKNGFTIIEVVVVFFLILGVAFFILPMTLNNTKQARLISKWTSNYSELEYIFSVLKAQGNLHVFDDIKKAPNNFDRENMVLTVVKPYLRIKYGVPTSQYTAYFMNNLKVSKEDKYHFNNYYYTAAGEIIGLNWLSSECSDKKTVCGIMSMDINGLKGPNTWGQDVFGINIFSNRIEPIGKDMNIDVLRQNCSRSGQGTYCSYYYLIGGKFD